VLPPDSKPTAFDAEAWESNWDEPPTEPTTIQQPAIRPTIEPDEATVDEIVAAANRSLSPEDQVVVDVRAIAIDPPSKQPSPPPSPQPEAPSKSPWDDWEDEDSNWAD
jgi:hypothetical protein